MARTKCKRGHDLTIPENVVAGGGTSCAVCRRQREREAKHIRVVRQRERERRIFDVCACCRRPKPPNMVKVCPECARGMMDRHDVTRELDMLQALESAPAWVKCGTDEEKAAWVAAMREDFDE